MKDTTGRSLDMELIAAVKKRDFVAVRTLLQRGANSNATDSSGMTALMEAAASGDLGIAHLLLKRGADTRPRDKGFTIRLSSHGRVYPVFVHGRVALQYAYEMNRDTAMMRLLLNHGADVNVRDGDGGTLLISTAGAGETEKARLLLSRKAALHVRDRWNRTALMQARGNGYSDIVALLLKAGAKE